MQKDKPIAFPVPGKCYARFFPNCTEPRCKKFCVQPLPGAVCLDKKPAAALLLNYKCR